MQSVQGYRLGEALYTGAHTMVYRAVAQRDLRHVLLKLPVKSDQYEDLARFRHESDLVLALAHEGTLPPHRLEEEADSLYLVCPDTGGETLISLIRAGKVGLERFFWIAIDLAERLQGIHDQQIIHKDVNPHNVLVNLESESADLMTLSIATSLSREDNKDLSAQKLEGLPQYISPEQTGRMNRAIDYRTDFYSLGVTFYEMLTGKLPFGSGDLLGLVHCHIAVTPAKPSELDPEIPETLSEIVMKLLAKNAEDRYQSGYGLAADLKECRKRYRETGRVEAFAIASKDFTQGLHIPQKLYGREEEIAILMAAFGRVSQGSSELMLVAGYSGIGKSALVREVHKPIVRKRGYFISGKFELHKKNIPYFAFAQAFRDLTRQLLTETAEDLEAWKKRLLAALGSNGQILIDVIPEIEHIIGKQPPVPDLEPLEAENRFRATFQSFIRIFTKEEHPLALFLDDLQWADSASLELIHFLITDPENLYLFLIGSYRDNEVDEAHPLTLALEEIAAKNAVVSKITLTPLELVDITQLVIDTFNCNTATGEPLARLLREKTDGNPFFLTQFLHSLHEEKLVSFRLDERRWSWNVGKIEAKESTDNVIVLMVRRLGRLTERTRDALTLASCVGSEFDLRTLSWVTDQSLETMAESLWGAARIGLITPIGDSYKLVRGWKSRQTGERPLTPAGDLIVSYKFFHDRIQQAAHSLLSEDDRKRIHLRLGRALFEHNSDPDDLEDRVFEIVNHLAESIDLIEDPKERRRFAELHLAAGRKAIDSTAYKVARSYLSIGVSLLPDDAWENDYELAMSLYRLKSESDYLDRDFETADAGFDLTLRKAQTLHEKGDIYTLKAVLARHAARYDDALDVHIEGLRQFGIEMPDYRREPERFNSIIEADVAELQETLRGRDVESLADLPRMTDPDKLSMTNLLEDLVILGYFYSRTMPQFASLKMLKTILEYGNCSASPMAFTLYGMLLGSELDDFKTGHRFGKMAFGLAKKQGNQGAVSKAGFFLGFVLNHWREHVRESLPILRESYLAGLASGNISYSGMASFFMGCYTFFNDDNLEEVIRVFSRYFDIMEPQSRNAAEAYHDMALRLRGDAAAVHRESALKGDYHERITAPGMELALQHYYNTRMIYYYLLGYHHSALQELEKADKVGRIEDILYNQYAPTERFFYSALVFAALHDEASEEEKAQYLARIADYRDLMAKFAEDCPDNFLMKAHLLSAEIARLEERPLEAMELYDQAIDAAKEYGFVKIEAIARELAAKFYLVLGRRPIARIYMQQAFRCYNRWGADAKLEHLRENYSDLVADAPTEGRDAGSDTGQLALPAGLDAETIDLLTVMRASQAISGEIVLPKLLERLMRLGMENAGAQKGFLILERDGELQIAASGHPGDDIRVGPAVPVQSSGELPLSVIQYVERTGETLALGDASEDGLFQNDPYILAHGVKSVLCLPSMRQKGRLGILYLENSLVANAFPPDRIRTLQLLAAQAAISLENAVLYDTLEQQVEARTQELIVKNEELEKTLESLNEARDRMIVQDRLASLGSLSAGIAHELKNPLNFVNNFAELSVELLDEVGEELVGLEMDAEKSDYVKEIMGDLKVNLERINRHGRQADGIIRSMLEHSRSSEGIHQECDVNELVKEHTNLAYHGLRTQDPSFSVEVDLDLDESLGTIQAAPQELGRVVINIIQNGCYAANARRRKAQESGEAFSPRLRVQTRNKGERVEIRIRDNGMGIPAHIRDRVFNPFFTTKNAGEGTGLGLSLSHDIVVQGHRGELSFESVEGDHTEFVIDLPKS